MSKNQTTAPTRKIQHNLHSIPFGKDANKYYARVKTQKALSVDDICRLAQQRGGSAFDADEIKMCVNDFLCEMAYQLSNGMSVNTGFFHVEPTIKGVFESKSDKFDAKRHSVGFSFNQGVKMKPYADKCIVENINTTADALTFDYVYDYHSKSLNDRLTPGKNILIKGTHIKTTGTDESVGIYFTNLDTAEVFKVDASSIMENKRVKLILLTPMLTKGRYTIKIVTQNVWGKKESAMLKTIYLSPDKELLVE